MVADIDRLSNQQRRIIAQKIIQQLIDLNDDQACLHIRILSNPFPFSMGVEIQGAIYLCFIVGFADVLDSKFPDLGKHYGHTVTSWRKVHE